MPLCETAPAGRSGSREQNDALRHRGPLPLRQALVCQFLVYPGCDSKLRAGVGTRAEAGTAPLAFVDVRPSRRKMGGNGAQCGLFACASRALRLSAFLGCDRRKRRYQLLHPLAPAMGTLRYVSIVVRHVLGPGELFVAILAMKNVFRHGSSPDPRWPFSSQHHSSICDG